MKKYLITLVALVSLMEIKHLNAEPNGKAASSPANSSITGVVRSKDNLGCLVLQKDQQDLVEICSAAPGGIIPKLQDACMQDDQLAVVLDYDNWFCYQRYEQVGGIWALKQKTYFNTMNLSRKQRLLLVEMSDLTHAKLTFSKKGDSLFRKKGVIQPGDREEIFAFSRNGTVLKNGNPYNYNSGRETN
ncbi:MAG: hypothetical protein WCD79_18010 [Chthoniobacteraceae bacterium]